MKRPDNFLRVMPDYLAARIAPKFGVSTEVIAKRCEATDCK